MRCGTDWTEPEMYPAELQKDTNKFLLQVTYAPFDSITQYYLQVSTSDTRDVMRSLLLQLSDQMTKSFALWPATSNRKSWVNRMILHFKNCKITIWKFCTVK